VEKTVGCRVMDGAQVEIMAGVVVRQVSASFPNQLPDGRVERTVRFMAAADSQWYELLQDAYLKGIGAPGTDRVGKALQVAGAILGAIIVVGEASKGRLPR